MEQISNKAPAIRGSEAVRYGYEKVYSSVLQLDPSLSFLIDYVRETCPPKRGEFQHLLPKARAGDTAARSRIIEMYTRDILCLSLSHSEQYGFPISDVFQSGFVLLIEAIDRFDPARLNEFHGFSSFLISRKLLYTCIQDLCSSRFPAKTLLTTLNAVQDICTREGFISLSADEFRTDLVAGLCRKLKISEERAEVLLHALLQEDSLDEMFEECRRVEEGTGATPYPVSPEVVFKPVSDRCLRDSLDRSISSVKKLSPRYKEILYCRFGLNAEEPKSTEELAAEAHCSRSRMGQIVVAALLKLRVSSKTKHLHDFLVDAS